MKNRISVLIEEKSWPWILLIAVIPVVLLYRILFLGELIRASDITSQYYWGVLDYGKSWIPTPLSELWIPYVNFGTDGSVGYATYLLPWRLLTYMIFPLPVSIAWEIVTHLIFAGIGTFLYCRIIGLNRFSAFLSALFFILSSQLITLINAGHVGKINTIAWTPWIFLALEKGLREKRAFHFLLAGGALAFQFLEMHWQVSFYTCLAVGFYFIFRVTGIYSKKKDAAETGRLTLCAALMVAVFFAASSVSFLPVYEWSKTTERAGGMSKQEGMNWSMPPEELVTYAVPGFFGLSRKEAGPDPGYIDVYYWGRMIFTQTTNYLGILPLVFASAALLYRRNAYVKIFLFLAVFSMIVAMGKYTPVYRFMFDYLPGFSTFRVPKMILFLFAFAVSVTAGFGAQWLLFDEDERKGERTGKILRGLLLLLAVTAVLTLCAYIFRDSLIDLFRSDLTRSFRWKQPPDIADRRFMNIIRGSVTFMVILALSAFLLSLGRREGASKQWLMLLIPALFIADVWNVNGRFIVTVPPPEVKKTEVIRFLEGDDDLFRVAPLTGEDSFLYTYFKVPVISSYLAVSEREFAEYRDRLDLRGNLLDMMNVKYVVMSGREIGDPPLGAAFLGKYTVVFKDGKGAVVLRNNRYLPRAYPVHRVVVERDRNRIFHILNHPRFRPREMVLIEEPPPPMPSSSLPVSSSKVEISRYGRDVITAEVEMARNGFVVFSEKYYPGWKAYVDGKETKIFKANYIMRAVYVPRGAHEIRMVFDPVPYRAGLMVSSATFLFLAGMVMWRTMRKGAADRK